MSGGDAAAAGPDAATDDSPVRLAVTGAGGRMGREVIGAASDRGDVAVALAVNRSEAEPVAGVAVEPAADLAARLAEADADVLVDFTGPDSSVDYVEACAAAGVAAVVGTTGFDDAQRDRLAAAAADVPVLRAANFARGVRALRRAVQEAVAALPGYDVELTETHHNGKRDAPSGTARTILEDIEAEREEPTDRRRAGGDAGSQYTHGREGDQPREADEIGVHARRAGDVTGEHEVLLAGNREVLELTHRAGSRGVFAEGALDAAVWLADRDPGQYDFDAVIDAE